MALSGKLATLPNLADVKDALFRQVSTTKRLPQENGRLVDVLERQSPGSPMNGQGEATASLGEDLDGVKRVGVHAGEGNAWMVGADGDEAEIKGSAQVADVTEVRTPGEKGRKGRPVVVAARGEARNGTVARIAAEPDGPMAGADGPRAPQCSVPVEGGPARRMLARETGDAGRDAGPGPVCGSGLDRQLGVFPPIQLRDVPQPAPTKPRLQPEPDEEMHVRMPTLDAHDGRQREVIVVTVADDDGVYRRYIGR